MERQSGTTGSHLLWVIYVCLSQFIAVDPSAGSHSDFRLSMPLQVIRSHHCMTECVAAIINIQSGASLLWYKTTQGNASPRLKMVTVPYGLRFCGCGLKHDVAEMVNFSFNGSSAMELSHEDNRLTNLSSLDRFTHSFPLVLLMLANILGNSCLIIVIASTRSLHTITNLFIISLATSDLLAGAVVIPINLALPTTLFYGYTTCMYAACFTIIVAIGSMTNIFAVTFDRYIAITSPLHYRVKMRPSIAMCMIGLAWVYSIVLGLLPMMGWRVSESTCFRGETYHPYYTLLIFFSGCIFPVWGSGILYMRIFKMVRNHQRRIKRVGHRGRCNRTLTPNDSQVSFISQANYNDFDSNEIELRGLRVVQARRNLSRKASLSMTQVYNWSSTSRKTIKTLAILMVYFEMSWLPVFITMILDAFIHPRLMPPWLHSVFGTLAFVNSAMDPIIYGYRNKDIKNAFSQKFRLLAQRILFRRAMKDNSHETIWMYGQWLQWRVIFHPKRAILTIAHERHFSWDNLEIWTSIARKSCA